MKTIMITVFGSDDSHDDNGDGDDVNNDDVNTKVMRTDADLEGLLRWLVCYFCPAD